MWVALGITVVILAVVAACLVLQVRRVRRKKRELKQVKENLVLYFGKGRLSELDPNGAVAEQAELLPYDPAWELDRKDIRLGKTHEGLLRVGCRASWEGGFARVCEGARSAPTAMPFRFLPRRETAGRGVVRARRLSVRPRPRPDDPGRDGGGGEDGEVTRRRHSPREPHGRAQDPEPLGEAHQHREHARSQHRPLEQR